MGVGGEGKVFWEIELSLPGPQEGVKNREKKVISRIPNYPTSQMHPFLLLHTSGLRSHSSLPGMSFPLLCSRPKPAKPSFLQAADQGRPWLCGPATNLLWDLGKSFLFSGLRFPL